MSSYSIDILKKYVFQDELTNIIATMKIELPIDCALENFQELMIIKCYFQKRINEIDIQYE